MQTEALYEAVDGLNELWTKIESHLKGITVKKEGLRLSVERVGEKMRLCFDGKPVCEHKADAKVEAVDYIDALIQARLDLQDELTEKAKAGKIKLQQILWQLAETKGHD